MMGVVVKDFGEPARRGGAVSRGCYDGSTNLDIYTIDNTKTSIYNLFTKKIVLHPSGEDVQPFPQQPNPSPRRDCVPCPHQNQYLLFPVLAHR